MASPVMLADVKAADSAQKRVLFFAFDGGIGVGHLRRLACVARQLQGRFSCLIVTGQRAAAHWFVPEECEFIHIPHWDSLLAARAGYWGREPFVTVDVAEAVRLRRDLLAGIVRAYRPDVIFVDHLPLGAHDELAEIIAETTCLKYMVMRGVLSETRDLRRLVLGGRAHEYLSQHYHRVFIASDIRVFDFSQQYNIAADIRRKTTHTGYVTERIPPHETKRTRADRGLAEDDTWVVASAGGGQLGEALIESCCELARTRRDIAFDVVLGPQSNVPWTEHRSVVVEDNLRLHRETRDMPYLHASADVVISSGGYNSLLETLQGNAKILCFPKRLDPRDEQYRHSTRLKKFVDIDVSTDFVGDLPTLFERALASRQPGGPPDRRRELNFDGAAAIEQMVLDDLGLLP